MFNCSPVFYENYQAKEKVLINQGGTASSKTYSIMQLLFYKAVNQDRSIITVAGESLPNLRKGAYRDAEMIFADNKYLQSQLKFWNKTERIIYFKNGSLIEFVSFENEQSAKNGKRNYLFVNEANGITYQIYWQLAIRTKNQIYIDYNPTNEFWAHTKLIGQPDTRLIISDHRHNPFLTEQDHQRIEDIKDLDLELWHVYARGLTGKIEGVIFRNWAVCEAIPEDAELISYGIDFGFTNDPTGIIEVYKSGGELWVNEMCYETRLTNMDICQKLRDFKVSPEQEIIADSAEPKSIQEIYAEGFNIHGAMKGPDSIKQGIDILKRYKINVTANSHNLKKEFYSYIWKKDKTGKLLNEPIDAFNHLIDPLRYVALNKLASKFVQEYSFEW